MNEQLLQFIWRFQYFNQSALKTTNGEFLEVISPGTLNTNQGPDFLNARIRILNTIWAGTVELHNKSSDWSKHKHDTDDNYKNVILHVVYENDSNDNNNIAVLELKKRIAFSLLKRYTELMHSQQFIPCENLIKRVPEPAVGMWKERLAAERLQRKTGVIHNYLKKTHNHWETCFWWLLAKNFGIKTNSDAFESIARSIPLNVLGRYKSQQVQLEALLLGQAGLLGDDFKDKYPVLLKKVFEFLRIKHQLSPVVFPVCFLRMRPGNFPTLRLAQLAALIFKSIHLFSKIIEEPDLNIVRGWFTLAPNDFWSYHYTLTDEPFFKHKPIGSEMINNIVINTIIPMVFAYGQIHQNQIMKDRALEWLNQAKPERNIITMGFKNLGFRNESAWDSQTLTELKTQYCDHKYCLNCSIGNKIIKS